MASPPNPFSKKTSTYSSELGVGVTSLGKPSCTALTLAWARRPLHTPPWSPPTPLTSLHCHCLEPFLKGRAGLQTAQHRALCPEQLSGWLVQGPAGCVSN